MTDVPVTGVPQGYSPSDARLFRELLQFSSESYVLSRVDDGVVLEASQGFVELVGYDRDEVVGRRTSELAFVPFATRAEDVEFLKTRRFGQRLEADLLTKAGSLLNVEFSAQLIGGDGGEYLLTVVRDITLQTRRLNSIRVLTDSALANLDLDDLLAELLGRLRRLLDIDTAAVLLLDNKTDSLSLRAADGFEGDAAHAFEVGLGMGFAGRVAAGREAVAIVDVDRDNVLNPLLHELGIRSLLGVPLLVHGIPIGVVHVGSLTTREFDADEVDLLELVADRVALAIAHARALEQERWLADLNRAVLEATSDAIRVFDLSGSTVLTNPAMESLAKTVGDGSMIDEVWALASKTTDPDAYFDDVSDFAADPETTSVHEYRLAGSRRWIERETTPIRDAAGDVLGRLLILRDITAARDAETLKSELVATVSHELRTPLASVLGFAELALRDDLPETTRKHYLETILGEGKRLSALVDDFLDLQQIENGDFALACERVDLGRLLREEVKILAELHETELTVDGTSIVVLGEPRRIAQVVDNLISNAVKYSPEGGPVRVTAVVRDGVARVTVADEGLGIPASQQERIFTRFFRVDTSATRPIGGTGLGLALCREIVEAHGGAIGFDSVEGEGSSFWFELPTVD